MRKQTKQQSELVREYLQAVRLLLKLRGILERRFPFSASTYPGNEMLASSFNKLKARTQVMYGAEIARELAKREEEKL